MTSHHVTCHVTVVSHVFFIIQNKKKKREKENQYKIRKIKEKKDKNLLVLQHHITCIDCQKVWYQIGDCSLQQD